MMAKLQAPDSHVLSDFRSSYAPTNLHRKKRSRGNEKWWDGISGPSVGGPDSPPRFTEEL